MSHTATGTVLRSTDACERREPLRYGECYAVRTVALARLAERDALKYLPRQDGAFWSRAIVPAAGPKNTSPKTARF